MDDITQTWDLEIKPKSSLLNINLKELWHYRDLMWLFVRRDFVAQYKQTILGPLWHVIQPVFTTLMFLLVFGKIAKISTDGIEPILFYMSGITIWTYFSTCLTNTANTFVANAPIFGKVYFPRLILPLSVVMSNIVKFGIQFLLLFVMMLYFALFKHIPIVFSVNWLLIPVLILLMAGIGLGCGIIISSVTTKYRDFAVLLTFAVQLGMYVTPIGYPLSYLQSKPYKWVITINPLTSIVEAFRYSLFGKGTVDTGSILYSVIFMIVVLIIGAIYFNKVEKTFMDTV
ncbi:ABC transporter permease [Mucilaginibacter sp. PPCGB 2223]|uniref:ABC transporter permease n=1 Tax=Mucilaginibacter sp. PPCGB 2223 TaxID=1886027 RepID=UPI0008264454|nr:ABC transporter permease [Mucilaginibacter sp. PPCGB 2223]OCX54572.1 ABC transporter permease [Mucilaginibacter sp. PPCGB 2223]